MCVCVYVHISWGMKKSHGSIKEKEEERHFLWPYGLDAQNDTVNPFYP